MFKWVKNIKMIRLNFINLEVQRGLILISILDIDLSDWGSSLFNLVWCKDVEEQLTEYRMYLTLFCIFHWAYKNGKIKFKFGNGNIYFDIETNKEIK